MRYIKILILFILVTPSLSNAQNTSYVRAGINYTTFRGEKTYLQTGSTFCIGYQWNDSRIARWFKASSLALEFLYTNKKAILKNKTIGAISPGGYLDIVYYDDIYFSVSLIEIPLLLTYSFPVSQKLKLQFHLGPDVSIAVKDKSKVKRRMIKSLEPNEGANFPFDYIYNPGDPTILWSGGYLLNFGFCLSFSHFSFDIRFSPALSYEFVTIRSINMHETPDTVHFLITFRMNSD